MASFLKHRGKERIKVQFDVLVRKISNVQVKPDSAESVFLYCTRSKNKSKDRIIKYSKILGSDINWNETVSFTSTLYKDSCSSAYAEKYVSLILKQGTKKSKKVAEWKLDVSKYVNSEEPTECSVSSKRSNKVCFPIIMQLAVRSVMLGKNFFSELPEELIESILRGLNDDSLVAAGRTCKTWHRLSADIFFHMGLTRTKQYVDHDTAIYYYTKSINLDSRCVQAYLMRGKELLRKGDRVVAVGDLQKALALDPSDVEAHVIKSIIYGIQGRYQCSIDESNRGLLAHPNEPMLYFERAFAKHDLMDFTGTVEDYTVCLELNSSTTYLYPGAFLVFNNRAWAYEMMGEWEKAIHDYSQSVFLNSKYYRALRGRARVRSKTGKAADLRGAIVDLLMAVLAEPRESTTYDRYLHFKLDTHGGVCGMSDKGGEKVTNAELRRMIDDAREAAGEYPESHKVFATGFIKQDLGDFSGAIDDYTKCIMMGYSYPYLAYNNRGRAYHKCGDIDKAIDDYSKAIELTPSDVAKSFLSALGNRCSALSARGDLQAALNDSGLMMKYDPKNSYGYRLHASVLVDHKKREEAIEFLGRGIAMCPLDDSIYEMRGIFFYEKGDREKAIADLSSAISLNPKSYEAFNYRARARSAIGDVDEALKDCVEMVKLEKTNHLGWTLYAAVLADHKRFDEAIQAASKAIEICPKSVRNRAEIYSDQGNLEAAVRDYTEALRIDQQDINAYKQRGYARTSLGQLDDAIIDYTTALRLGANDTHTLNNLGNCRAMTGDFLGAIADYSQALTGNPRDTEILLNKANVEFAGRNFVGAQGDYAEVLRLCPDDPDARRHSVKLNELQTAGTISPDQLRSMATIETLYFKFDSTFEKPIGRSKSKLDELAKASCGQK
jgi:tetratricopeptide (TPR) repeat protein